MDRGDTKMLSPGVIVDSCRYTSRANETLAAARLTTDCVGFDDAIALTRTVSESVA